MRDEARSQRLALRLWLRSQNGELQFSQVSRGVQPNCRSRGPSVLKLQGSLRAPDSKSPQSLIGRDFGAVKKNIILIALGPTPLC
jgi:hypothetical protein